MSFSMRLQQASLAQLAAEKSNHSSKIGVKPSVESGALLKIKQNISLLAEISQMQPATFSLY